MLSNLGSFGLQKSWVNGDRAAACDCRVGEERKGRARLCLEVCGERMGGADTSCCQGNCSCMLGEAKLHCEGVPPEEGP